MEKISFITFIAMHYSFFYLDPYHFSFYAVTGHMMMMAQALLSQDTARGTKVTIQSGADPCVILKIQGLVGKMLAAAAV